MKNRLLMLLSLFTLSSYAGAKNSKSKVAMAPGQAKLISQKEFETFRNCLPQELKVLINDFEDWEKEDKDKLLVHGHLIVTAHSLKAEKQAPYGGNISHWACHNAKKHGQRSLLALCLKYLKQENNQ